jgi:hypothetical protein
VHEPVGCVGQPIFDRSIDFTESEVDGMTQEVYDKIKTRIIILRERINTQCAINEEHDKLHDTTD